MEVVPLAGTWIEIIMRKRHLVKNYVVPLAGTWIEIVCARCSFLW